MAATGHFANPRRLYHRWRLRHFATFGRERFIPLMGVPRVLLERTDWVSALSVEAVGSAVWLKAGKRPRSLDHSAWWFK